MAHKNLEIEIKIKVTKTDFLQAKSICKKIGHPHQKIHQIDVYYMPIHRNFLKPKYPYEWLRIGKRGNKIILNYKHLYPENVDVFTHSHEYETKIDNYEKFLKIFKALNFKKIISVNKQRTCFIYLDQFEIAFDQVRNLGFFIEIEALQNFGGVKKTNLKLRQFAKKIKIDHIIPEKRGYPYLLLKKRKLI